MMLSLLFQQPYASMLLTSLKTKGRLCRYVMLVLDDVLDNILDDVLYHWLMVIGMWLFRKEVGNAEQSLVVGLGWEG